MSDENELYEQWRGAAEGERCDLETRLFQKVLRHAKAVVWIGLHERNPDLAQDIALAVLRNLSGFRGDSKFSTWVQAIAERKVDEELRKRIRRRNVFDERKVVVTNPEEEEVVGAVHPTELPDFDSGIAFGEICRRLPTEEDAMLLRCKRDGMSSVEIAARMGISQEAVDSRWARLKPRIQKES